MAAATATETSRAAVVLLPDAGPLITLAHADALHLLHKPGWPVRVVDMVLHEVTRNATPTSEKIGRWVAERSIVVLGTRTFQRHLAAQSGDEAPRKANLGELAIQETMTDLALATPATTGVFLFEDHKIARASFLLPANCRKISTRAWLLFLEGRGWIDSADAIERAAIASGRNFSRLRFPPG
ncbi:MAG: hypothetical protein Q7U85_09215 [Rhodocyclaceae bacterium]|nr:hypothetical protein [Rhodocyclaceae bacterium]